MGYKKVLHVGIDLGTSRSVIAGDNGMRAFVASYVGFPKDAVAMKMFGKREVIFGDEAIKNRLSLDLHRPFDKGKLKYTDSLENKTKEFEKAKSVARKLLRHLISLATEEETEELIIRGVIGAPALASVKNKKTLIDIADGVLDDSMIVSEPFAVAYGLDLFSSALIIDIWSRHC